EELEAAQRKAAIAAALEQAGVKAEDLDNSTKAALESCPVEHVTKIVEFFAGRVARPVSRPPGDGGADKPLEDLIVAAFDR
ncbi:MAG: hypothetical protein D6760_11120, partial [Deltaproteobacteria bacterium]